MNDCYRSIDAVPAPTWSQIVSPDRLYLGTDYLRALEDAAPPRLGFRYVVLDEVGVASIQLVDVIPGECVPALIDETVVDESPWQRWLRRGAAAVLAERRLRVLLCGNVFAGGEPGLAWRSPREVSRAFGLAAAAMKQLGRVEAERGIDPVLLFKDVGEADRAAARLALAPLGFREVPVDPIMVLAIRSGWRRFDDYLSALRARYRGHARQALRAAEGLERRELDSAEIAARAAEINRLHAAVVARAAVRPSWLAARGFAALRARLGDGFSFVGYFDDGNLVAFNTRFHRGGDLESHYFGLDYAVSRRYALYRTMLYDDITAAIDRGDRRVLFGRMSCELKSTLGAVPHAMSWFGKSSSPWITGAIAHVIQRLKPGGVLHDPFRA